ncbi:restriction endonuclease subunit S [Chloroflexota bacterium]
MPFSIQIFLYLIGPDETHIKILNNAIYNGKKVDLNVNIIYLEYYRGGTPATSVIEFWKNGSIPWINSGELSKNDYIKEPTTLISDRALKFSSAKLAPKHSVGIALTGATTGMVGFYEIETTTNQSIVSILPNRKVDTLYIFHYLNNSRRKILSFNIGSAQPHINKQIVDKLEIDFPISRTEQLKIAEILSKLDRAIEQTKGLIAKQQRIKTGLMQDLLTHGIDEHGNIRSEETHQFKDSPLGRIPVDWVCSLLSHFVPSAEYGISSSIGESGYPVLRMNNFFAGEAEISDLKYTDQKVPERLWLRDGDVLFNRTNSWEHVGRTGIWRHQLEKVTFASYLVRLNPDPDKLCSELLNLWLNWAPTQIAMRRFATPGVQQVNINPTNLRSIYATFPSRLTEQVEIVKRISSIRNFTSSLVDRLTKLGSLKTALMQDLLTGKVPVTPLLEKTEASG